MSGRAAYDAWAPRGARWSPWVKPVLFAHLDDVPPAATPLPSVAFTRLLVEDDAPPAGAPHRSNARRVDTAIVVDLPAETSLAVGLRLLDAGFFPVPTFNALPHPEGVVPLEATMARLAATVALRAEARLAEDAPPAFLLDARRSKAPSQRDRFDNRSFVSSTDFPSPETLARCGVSRIVVVAETIADDLAAVLLSAKAAGSRLFQLEPSRGTPPHPLPLVAPSPLARLVRWFATPALSPSDDGSFGRPRHHG